MKIPGEQPTRHFTQVDAPLGVRNVQLRGFVQQLTNAATQF